MKSQVWVPDDEQVWKCMKIKSVTTSNGTIFIVVQDESGEKTFTCEAKALENAENNNKLPQLCNPTVVQDTDDLTSLTYLNEPSVLYTLKNRYQQLQIYSYSGIVLIAINPFQNISSHYNDDVIQAYHGKLRSEVDPHLFAIAEEAFNCLKKDKINQTIVVSGESGAGKTVSAKYIMRYLVAVQGNGQSNSLIENQILATNPIMEAFGNAKSTRNCNSSRFGKYIELQFDSKNNLVGAKMKVYLLERSRVIYQAPGERNYHIFYYLLCGATELQKAELVLDEEFHYLTQGSSQKIDGVNDGLDLAITRKALDNVGICDQIQEEIFKYLAGILHIGNIKINGTKNAYVDQDDPNLIISCRLLGFDKKKFGSRLSRKLIKSGTEYIDTFLTIQQALIVRDSVAKFLYTKLFEWLVDRINDSLSIENPNSFIGVLDIYGFEHFEKNSFEQFCINYANEKLQQQFNEHVFKLEQKEYQKEGIKWDFIDFLDNQKCIDLIENRSGLISLLDEESRMLTGNDYSWLHKVNQSFDKPEFSKVYHKSRFNNNSFTLSHYALDVTYEAKGFVEKNQDVVTDEVRSLVDDSNVNFIVNLTKKNGVETKRSPTLAILFKNSLVQLMKTIYDTNVHYIRCIKPNNESKAWEFNNETVVQQLRACGVLETIKMSLNGFPSRWSFDDISQRYFLLLLSKDWCDDPKVMAQQIIANVFKDELSFQFGLTKIFLRPGLLAILEREREEILTYRVTCIQKNFRAFATRKKVLKYKSDIIKIQALIRGYLQRIIFRALRLNNAANVIRAYYLGSKARKNFKSLIRGTIVVQSLYKKRKSIQKLVELRQQRAALIIQKNLKMYICRQRYKNYMNAVITIQTIRRRKLALKRLKEDKNGLETEIVVLTENLNMQTRKNHQLLMLLAKAKSYNLELEKRYETAIQKLQNLTKRSDISKKTSENIKQLENRIKELDGIISKENLVVESIRSKNKSLKEELEKKNGLLKTATENVFKEMNSRIKLEEEYEILHSNLKQMENILVRKYKCVEGLRIVEKLKNHNGNLQSEFRMKGIDFKVIIHEYIEEFVCKFEAIEDAMIPSNLLNWIVEKLLLNDKLGETMNLLAKTETEISNIVKNSTKDRALKCGMLWISNVHGIYSFFHQVFQELKPIMNPSFALLRIAKTDLENLEFNIYIHILEECKKFINPLIIPGIVEAQHLSSFKESSIKKKLAWKGSPAEESTDKIVQFLNEIRDLAMLYNVEKLIWHSLIKDLYGKMAVKSFNDFINKKQFLTWKRTLQIQFNISRLNEWLIQENIVFEPNFENPFEYLLQAVNICQMLKHNIVSLDDIMQESRLLNAAQRRKFIMNYDRRGEYEYTIRPEMLRILADEVKENQNMPLYLSESQTSCFKTPEIRATNLDNMEFSNCIQSETLLRFVELLKVEQILETNNITTGSRKIADSNKENEF